MGYNARNYKSNSHCKAIIIESFFIFNAKHKINSFLKEVFKTILETDYIVHLFGQKSPFF